MDSDASLVARDLTQAKSFRTSHSLPCRNWEQSLAKTARILLAMIVGGVQNLRKTPAVEI